MALWRHLPARMVSTNCFTLAIALFGKRAGAFGALPWLAAADCHITGQNLIRRDKDVWRAGFCAVVIEPKLALVFAPVA